jgi:hypothetical protein
MSQRQPISIQRCFREMLGWPGRYFDLIELLVSPEALDHELSNLPTPDELFRFSRLVMEVMDPIREVWGEPLTITSGFRCPELNELVHGEPGSDHQGQMGAAADFRPCGAFLEQIPILYRLIAENSILGQGKLVFDQLILYPGWVHVGWRPEGNRLEFRKAVQQMAAGGTWRKEWPVLSWNEIRALPER